MELSQHNTTQHNTSKLVYTHSLHEQCPAVCSSDLLANLCLERLDLVRTHSAGLPLFLQQVEDPEEPAHSLHVSLHGGQSVRQESPGNASGGTGKALGSPEEAAGELREISRGPRLSESCDKQKREKT